MHQRGFRKETCYRCKVTQEIANARAHVEAGPDTPHWDKGTVWRKVKNTKEYKTFFLIDKRRKSQRPLDTRSFVACVYGRSRLNFSWEIFPLLSEK